MTPMQIPIFSLMLLISVVAGEPSILVAEPTEDPTVDATQYAWLTEAEAAESVPLQAAFPVPSGWTRVPVASGSWAEWLRGLPIRQDRTEVLAYDGSEVRYAPAAAVIRMDVGDRNLQQCADTALRLHAEYHWTNGTADDAVGYHYTSGDYLGWKEYRTGERLVVADGDVKRRHNGARRSGYVDFRGYLTRMFIYAGTRSLRLDSTPVAPEEELQAGDVFNRGGSPGHAVIVLDVAEREDGDRYALLGQGFMPAQELHVLRSDEAIDGVWFRLPDANETLETPSWEAFERSDAIRFR